MLKSCTWREGIEKQQMKDLVYIAQYVYYAKCILIKTSDTAGMHFPFSFPILNREVDCLAADWS